MSTETPSLSPSTDSFDQEVLQAKLPTLVDFWAPWCGPCNALKPTVQSLVQHFEGRAQVAFVNVEDNPELAVRYGVQSIPALRVFKDGEVVAQQVGGGTREDLIAFVEKGLQS